MKKIKTVHVGMSADMIHTGHFKGSGDRYLNHLYTIKKWHVQQERFPIAESITLY